MNRITITNNEYWTEFSTLINGRFNEAAYWYSAKAIYTYKGFSIVFDEYRGVTRVYCRFAYAHPIELRIDRASFVNKIANVFNGKLIKTNDRKFDQRYVVHSSNRDIGSILNTIVRKLYIDLNIEGLFISTNKGIREEEVLFDGHYELALYINEAGVDYNYLMQIKGLFELLVDHLSSKYKVESVDFVDV